MRVVISARGNNSLDNAAGQYDTGPGAFRACGLPPTMLCCPVACWPLLLLLLKPLYGLLPAKWRADFEKWWHATVLPVLPGFVQKLFGARAAAEQEDEALMASFKAASKNWQAMNKSRHGGG